MIIIFGVRKYLKDIERRKSKAPMNNNNKLADGLTDLGTHIQVIMNTILWGIGVIGVIIVIAIGFQFMTAQQAEERQKLKSRLLWFGIGTGIVLASSTIWTVLQNVFKA